MANRYFANQTGIPRIEADTVTVSDTAVTFNFNANAFIPIRYSGLVLFKLPAYTAPTTAVPVIFNTSGVGSLNLILFGGANMTSAELQGAGIILTYFENGTLLLLSYVPTPTA